MKRLVLTTAALLLAAGLAGCGRGESAKTVAASPAPDAGPAPADGGPPAGPSSAMAGMDMAAGTMMAKGSGTITAVDAAQGTVTIDHGPIAEAGWPAMTMAFKAPPEVVGQVKPGDRIDFDLKLQGAVGEVTAVRKR